MTVKHVVAGVTYYFESEEHMKKAFECKHESSSMRSFASAIYIKDTGRCLKNRYVSEELADKLYSELKVKVRSFDDLEALLKIGE